MEIVKMRVTQVLIRKSCVPLKNRLCKLMPSAIKLIRQAILHYADSVMKRYEV